MPTNNSSRLTPAQLQAMARVNRYLARLDLGEGQNLWLKTEVLKALEQADAASSVESVFAQSFAVLQQRLEDLYQGEEQGGVNHRMAGSAQAWNQRKPIKRTPMASLPFDRSWRSAGKRGWHSLQSALPIIPLRGIMAFPAKVFARI